MIAPLIFFCNENSKIDPIPTTAMVSPINTDKKLTEKGNPIIVCSMYETHNEMITDFMNPPSITIHFFPSLIR
jgi:hypothetical protein